MKDFFLYRKRLIPSECILLGDDEIVSFSENKIVSRWKALHPKPDLHHGISCFFLDLGCKVSKFYREDGSLLYWYIDIIDYSWNNEVITYARGEAPGTPPVSIVSEKEYSDTCKHLLVTDLLADVLIYPDGFVKVVDIEELSDALEAGLITTKQLTRSLRYLSRVLEMIYDGQFEDLKKYIEGFE